MIRCIKLIGLASLAVLSLRGIAAPTATKDEAVERPVTVDGISRNYLVFAPKDPTNLYP